MSFQLKIISKGAKFIKNAHLTLTEIEKITQKTDYVWEKNNI